MKKREWKRDYQELEAAYQALHKDAREVGMRRAVAEGRLARQEKALAYFRHQLNQAIETADHGHTVPPGSLHETSERLTLLRGRREAYAQVLSMLQAPVPPHFNPGTVNVYAERFVTASEE
jgi:hypothetical protein